MEKPMARPISPFTEPPEAAVSSAWLERLGLRPTTQRWSAEIVLDVVDEPAPVSFDATSATRLHVKIEAHYWMVFCCHRGRSSELRIAEDVTVRGRDDFGLERTLPPLDHLHELVRDLEQRHGVVFERKHAMIRTSLEFSESVIRAWVHAL